MISRSTPTSNLVLLLFLPFSSPISVRRFGYANLWWYLHLTNPHHFNRIRLHWQKRSLLALWIHLPKSCRSSYWDHASSLEFESIMLTSSPTPTKELAWLRSLFRSAYTFQLAMVCNQNTFAVITPWCSRMRIFWSSFVLIFLESFVSPRYVAGASLWYLEFHYVFRVRIFRLCFCILFWRPSHWCLTLIMIRKRLPDMHMYRTYKSRTFARLQRVPCLYHLVVRRLRSREIPTFRFIYYWLPPVCGSAVAESNISSQGKLGRNWQKRIQEQRIIQWSLATHHSQLKFVRAPGKRSKSC